ncbi:MAG: epimerase [Candidatus Fischerbacteria bacterium RBG_13_37_8]|uniref:Epimerase n=1 Tax=Candidatus Fischerbacteria bacterium RBG_13_37_8 TaxID=1817863 RepID=A0A1F5VSN9_9BACT|nr:MAG: epimerase [Candidatus Fischerbacteria bacterium RBG_13_37_8]
MNIVLTGANGYIGRRLLSELVEQGHTVHCFIRDKRRFNRGNLAENAVILHEVDLLKPIEANKLPLQIDAAYYLVHSLSTAVKDFESLEQQTARNFISYISQTTAAQIIYLGGIANAPQLSRHLASRNRVEGILKEGTKPVTVLRAGIIVGSGSASFEIIRDLVEKLPIMITPKWLNTKCQPIAVNDVITYLSAVLLHEKAYNKVFDIGGPDILSYKEMLLQYAEVRKLKRLIFTLPVLTPRLSSYWLYFITSTTFKLAQNLVESMKNEVIVVNKGIEEIKQFKMLTYREAVIYALHMISRNIILSSWKDSFITTNPNIKMMNTIATPSHGCYKDIRKIEIKGKAETVINNIWTIGGDKGWYYANFLWELRGFMDKLFGGVGLRRGRRSPSDLRPGDALDFWRVIVADKKKNRLLLSAEMKLPGEAWLEFSITTEDNKQFLNQVATFRPKGLLGRLYWYFLIPFHALVFSGMIKKITGNKE